jgi:hypothetical protein
MVFIKDCLRLHKVNAVFGLLFPGKGDQPVDIIARNSSFGRAGRHFAEFRKLFFSLFAGFIGHTGFGNRLFELFDFFGALISVAKFFLNGFHLFAQVVFFLDLLHLLAHLATDLLFHHHDLELAVENASDFFESFARNKSFENLLLFFDLEVEVGGDNVGETAGLLNVVGDHDHFERDLFIEFDILLEQTDYIAHQRLLFDGFFVFGQNSDALDLEEFVESGKAIDSYSGGAFDQYFQNAVRQLEKLKNFGNGAGFVELVGFRVIGFSLLLRAENDSAVFEHCLFDSPDRFFATDEKRHDHVGKYDYVPEWQQRIYFWCTRVVDVIKVFWIIAAIFYCHSDIPPTVIETILLQNCNFLNRKLKIFIF